ncbi:hypothetical protein ACWJJH_00370 [Endozoicomonadaceae bacterium StTr2]
MSDLEMDGTQYPEMTFKPHTSDSQPHQITRKKLLDIKRRRHQAVEDENDFLFPELRITVDNMLAHLEHLIHETPVTPSLKSDCSTFQAHLLQLILKGFPYSDTVTACFYHTRLLTFVYDHLFYSKFQLDLASKGLKQERDSFGSLEYLLEFNPRYEDPFPHVRIQLSRFHKSLDIHNPDHMVHIFSQKTVEEEQSFFFQQLQNLLSDPAITLFPTYENLSPRDFNRALPRRELFYFGLETDFFTHHDNRWMDIRRMFDHDIRHTILILAFITANLNSEIPERDIKTGLFEWGSFSYFNHTPAFDWSALQHCHLDDASGFLYDLIDYGLNLDKEISKKTREAIEIINFEIMHEDSTPYIALMDMNKLDVIKIVERIIAKGATYYSGYEHIEAADYAIAFVTILKYRDLVLSEWRKHCPVYFDPHKIIPASERWVCDDCDKCDELELTVPPPQLTEDPSPPATSATPINPMMPLVPPLK